MPPFLAFTTVMSPVISLFKITAAGVLRLMGVQPRDELETAITSDQLADLIAESGREGLLDDHGSRRLTRTLSSAGDTVADVLVTPVELVSLPQRPVVDDVARAVADTGFSRFPVRAGAGFSGYLHVKDILDIADDPAAEVPSQRIRRLPQVRVTDRLDVALAVLRRAGRTSGARSTPGAPRPGWSRWRTSSSTTSAPSATPPTHARSAPDIGRTVARWRRCRRAEWRARAAAHRHRVRRFTGPHRERKQRGEAHPVLDFLFTYYSYRPARLEEWHPGPGVVLLGGAEYLGGPATSRTSVGCASTRARSPGSRRPPGSCAPCSPPPRPAQPG